jgi:hypothetical protein
VLTCDDESVTRVPHEGVALVRPEQKPRMRRDVPRVVVAVRMPVEERTATPAPVGEAARPPRSPVILCVEMDMRAEARLRETAHAVV